MNELLLLLLQLVGECWHTFSEYLFTYGLGFYYSNVIETPFCEQFVYVDCMNKAQDIISPKKKMNGPSLA